MIDLNIENLTKAQKELSLRTQSYVDGNFVDSKSGETFPAISPRNGSILAEVASCQVADVDLAVAAARRAFEDGRWSGLRPAQRKAVMLRFVDLIRKNRLELALLETLDMGKPISDAYNVDVQSTATCMQFYAEAADKIYGEIAPTSPNIVAMIAREPVGVVGAVVPWNYPLLMAAWKLGPVLVTGNSIVIKPAEQSSLSLLKLAELSAEAGFPDGVFNVVTGLGDQVGAAIGLHMDIDAVAFTGSVEVGKLFLQYSSQSNMKSVSVECGGKSPQIVMADAHDLEQAARSVAGGIFFNQGEVCNAGSRLLVEGSIKDDFVSLVMDYSEDFQPSDPLEIDSTMGAVVDEKQMERILGFIKTGSDEGARLRKGGSQVHVDSGGYYVEPTIFDDVDPKMAIAQEEIFGPVLGVIPFSDVTQAIQIANDSRFGLAASVWTSNINVAHSVSRKLKAGTVWVNCFDSSDITVPFGGFKESGFGRDKSLHAIDKYTQLKTTWIELQ